MMSPLIPLEALLEVRRHLDSMPATQTSCERIPLGAEAAPTEAAFRPVSPTRARRQSPQAEKTKDELPSFQ